MYSYRAKSPESEAKIASMFDRIAGRYDFLNHFLSLWQDVRWRRMLLRAIPSQSRRLLDMATGTGDVAIAAAQKYSNLDVIGGDISKNMLLKAAEKSNEKELTRIKFQKMSATSIPLDDRAVDCVTIAFGLRNVPEKDKAMAEFSRVLDKKGRLLVLDFYLPKKGLLSWAFMTYFHYILPFVAGIFSDRSAYAYLPQSVGSFYSFNEIVEKADRLGMSLAFRKEYMFGAVKILGFDKR